ncbi:Hypothetical protein I595_2244 [Croceitalea dokdonensis DOKDO 023]|uniref:Uncharacterized protein n=1 Tax=Croceitalea dokdonensis DOKDO 023 TaxID=1300341 RepID=A0A0P7AEU2_9FLAO|nr:Hypothetical protein I595_2244 [Croceitalea dokdonensis DOKDO 023]
MAPGCLLTTAKQNDVGLEKRPKKKNKYTRKGQNLLSEASLIDVNEY